MKNSIYIFILLLTLLFAGCDNSSAGYELHSVSALTLSPLTAQCSSGAESYLLFVADEEKEETRVKLIDGCSGSFISNFNDPFDGSSGLLVDGAIQALAAVPAEEGNGIVLAVAGTGTIDPTDINSKKGSFLRFYDMIAISNITEENVSEIATPDMILFLDSQGKTISGITASYAFSVSSDLKEMKNEGDVSSLPINYACHEEYCVIQAKDGSLYKHVAGELISSIDFGVAEPIQGVFSLNKSRWAVTTNERVYLFNIDLLPAGELVMPLFVKPTSVTYLEVEDSFFYRLLSADSASEKVGLSIEETGTADDSDVTEVSDSDESYEFPDDDSLPDGVVDAEKHDIIVVATKNGGMMLFDMDSDGWMVRHFTSADSLSDEEIARRNDMKPFLYRYFRRYPDDEKTDSENAPILTELQVIRNIQFPIQYTAVFEGVSQQLTSNSGQFDSAAMVLGDKTLSFADYTLNSGEARLLVTNKRNDTDECTIPPSEAVSMGIDSTLSDHLLQVSMDKYAESVNDCFGPLLSYSLYPDSRYLISLIDPLFRTYETIGDEFPAGSSGDFTHSDAFADFRVEKVDDSLDTESGVTHIITIKPSIYYLGYQSDEMFEWSRQPLQGRLLLFSKTKRYIVDYDPLYQVLVQYYK